MPPLIVIAGATATGKTALALALAGRIEGLEIVSADSRQVYRGMDIGTAKPTPAERAVAPHHGLDLVDPDERFTAADHQRHALGALEAIGARGGCAALVGGSGLYLRAVARGLPLADGGADPVARASLERRLADEGLPALAVELASRAPDAAAAIDLRNPRRVVRALERLAVTGSARPDPPRGYAGPVAWIGLRQADAAHRRAIGERARRQLADGLLEEADRLRARYPEDLPAFSAVGYREAFDVLAGRFDEGAAIERITTRTWAYARRQRTWFRREPAIAWLGGGAGALEAALRTLAPFLRASGRADYPVER